MKTKLLLGTLSVAATLAVAPAVFADDDDEGTTTPGSVVGTTDAGSDTTYTTDTGSTVVIDREFSLTAQREATYTDSDDNEQEYAGFKGVSITTTGTVDGYELKITGATNDKTGTTTTDQNVYFIGANKDGTDSLTITSLVVDNGTSNKSYKTTKSFIVEGCTLTLDGSEDGINVTELGMSLNIGTMYDATVNIIDGAQLRTGGYLNTIGSNMATATINISGEGSLLDNQQVTVGGGVSSLFAGTMTSDGDYWTQYLISDADREAVIEALLNPDLKGKVGYGIVNITEGGTWQVGVGNGEYSISRLQLSNGEVNIDGAGSSLVFGNQSSLVMTATSAFRDSDGNYISTYWTQKVSVTNGGSVTVADGGSLYSLQIGVINYTSNNETAILVDGADENDKVSTLDLSVAGSAYIGYKNSDATGGTEVVTITASKGGVFNITATSAIYIASDSSSYGSYGMDVSLSAESGGSITITVDNSTSGIVYVGDHSAAEGYQNNLDVRATGDGSKVEISARTVYAAYISGNTTTSLGAYDGGSLSVATTNQIMFGYSSTEGGSITTTSDGNGSMALLSSVNILINRNTSSDFVSNFVASDGGHLSLTASSGFYVGYDGSGSGESNFTATGKDSEIEISGAQIFVDYKDSINTNFGAYDGGSLSISATSTSNPIVFGYNCSGSTSVTADGKDSQVLISCNNGTLYTNWSTNSDFSSSFTASDGGYLGLTASSFYCGNGGSGNINIAATGEGSLVYFYSPNYIAINFGKSSNLNTTITATDGGTVDLTATGWVYLYNNTKIVADNGGAIVLATGSSDSYYIDMQNCTVSITNNSTMSTTYSQVDNSSISIDATSTWTGGRTEFRESTELSISVGASAISVLGGDSGANVSLGDVYIGSAASITVTIDVSSLGYNESASVAVLNADSVTFDISNWTRMTGTELDNDNVNAFAAGYITADENGYTIDSWSYTNGTLYANITTTPEPSTFSLFLGLAAIALTATRRRRRNQ